MSARFYLLLVTLLFSLTIAWGQPPSSWCDSPVFLAPDTVCVNQLVTIDPGALSGSNFNWSFCSADAGNIPLASSLGNPSGVINNPRYITLAREGTECYAFMTIINMSLSSVVKIYFGNSFSNSPAYASNLGSIYVLTDDLRGLKMIRDNGIWNGFIVDGNTLYRFVFQGNTLAGALDIVNNIPIPGAEALSGLTIRNTETGWVGFVTDSQKNSLVRLRFQAGLTGTPVVDTLGNVGGLDNPTGLSLVDLNGTYHLFIANSGNSTLSRIDFGNPVLDPPSGVNLGNVGGLLNQCTGIEVTGDCNAINGYVTNLGPGANGLVQLHFPDGPAGQPVGTSLGNPGGLNEPFGMSGLDRVDDTIFTFIPNVTDNTLTRLVFPTCSAASRTGDQKLIPDPFYYLETGTWNIHLSYQDPSLGFQELCKPVVVMPELEVSLGPDLSFCQGDSVTLDAGPGYSSYIWSTGDTGRMVRVSAPGEYRVMVANTYGCEAGDTVQVTMTSTVDVTVDTLLCHGERYWAGGDWQELPGTYRDTTTSVSGCDSVTTTNLEFKPRIPVDLGLDTAICPDQQILLHATVPGASYLWQDGTADSVYLVTEPGVYRVEVTFDGCVQADSLKVGHCPVKVWFPTAFTPNGDGLNDAFKPRGISVGNFRMVIFDRWGQQLFESDSMERGWDGTWNGTVAPAGTYSFIAWFSGIETPGQTETTRGTFALLR